MKNKPKKIYLNIGAEGEATDFKELEGVSWCEDKINDDDLEYHDLEHTKEEFYKVGQELGIKINDLQRLRLVLKK